jgi:hypothetical protein
MNQRLSLARARVASTLAVLAAGAVLVVALACKSGPVFEPIVLELSPAKTPTAPASADAAPPPAATAIPSSPSTPPEKPKGGTAASVPVADLTPPPREKPEVSVEVGAGAASTDPAAIVERHRRAVAQGDVEAAVALYAPDARLYDGPDRLAATGRDAIRGELARWRGPGADPTLSGGFVSEKDAAGPGTLAVFEVRDGSIARVWIYR